ncbi:hypothetical protein JCM5353_007737, partial [Sporobolomyces roseus]
MPEERNPYEAEPRPARPIGRHGRATRVTAQNRGHSQQPRLALDTQSSGGTSARPLSMTQTPDGYTTLPRGVDLSSFGTFEEEQPHFPRHGDAPRPDLTEPYLPIRQPSLRAPAPEDYEALRRRVERGPRNSSRNRRESRLPEPQSPVREPLHLEGNATITNFDDLDFAAMPGAAGYHRVSREGS